MPSPDLLLRMTCEIAEDISSVPERPGVYVMFWSCPRYTDEDTVEAGPFRFDLIPLYTGATADSLRLRIKRHIFGDTRVSTLRASLGLILRAQLGLRAIPIPKKRYFYFEPEQRLTNWIVSNTAVGYCEADNPFTVEKAMLINQAGLLNIQGCDPTPLTRRLQMLRGAANGRRKG